MNREKNFVDQGEGVDEEIKILETEVKNLSFEESEEPKNETCDPLMQNLQNHLAKDSQCQSNNIPCEERDCMSMLEDDEETPVSNEERDAFLMLLFQRNFSTKSSIKFNLDEPKTEISLIPQTNSLGKQV